MHDATCHNTNKMLGSALPHLSADAIEDLSQKVKAYAQVQTHPRKTHNVTYICRRPPRCLTRMPGRHLFQKIANIPNVAFRVRNCARLTFQKQINLIANTDVLIGAHGNGLSHLLFLPKDACVIELFRPGLIHLDYRLFAKAKEIDYFGIMSQRGLISEKEAFQNTTYLSPNSKVTEIDIPLILSIIRSRF